MSGDRRRPIVIGVGNEFRRDDGIGPAVVQALRAENDRTAREDTAGDGALHDGSVQGGTVREGTVRERAAGDGAVAALAVTDGEPARLVELWAGAPLAVVIDAVRAEPSRPGRIHELGLDTVATSGLASGASSHALGLGEAAELGSAIGRMPERLHVVAVEGLDFGMGPGLSPPVAQVLGEVTERVRQVLSAWRLPT